MKHQSKLEVWLLAAIVYVIAVLLLGGNPWIGVPVLICLLYMAYPQQYITAPDALRARTTAASRPGYYLAEGNCYYRYPSGQYVQADPRACY